MPEPGVDFYLPKDVPHGEVRQHWYYSKLTSAWHPTMVYTPPGYDTSPGQRYPVLYLQHGRGENYTSWSGQGRATFIMDSLIAVGKAKPMIIVMENGSAGGPGAGAAGGRGGDAARRGPAPAGGAGTQQGAGRGPGAGPTNGRFGGRT